MGVTPMSPKTKNLSEALGRSPKPRCHLQTDVTSGTSGGCSAGVGERLIDFCCAGTAVKTERGSLADIKAPPLAQPLHFAWKRERRMASAQLSTPKSQWGPPGLAPVGAGRGCTQCSMSQLCHQLGGVSWPYG